MLIEDYKRVNDKKSSVVHNLENTSKICSKYKSVLIKNIYYSILNNIIIVNK